MTRVLDWRRSNDPRLVIERAVQALAEGQLVAFPTESVYAVAASALIPEAVERLVQWQGNGDQRLTLALPSAADALDWLPGLSSLGRRLARRCWPGPVTLVCQDGVESGLAGRLTEQVRQRVCRDGSLGLCVPHHEAIGSTVRLFPGPVILTSARRDGEPEAMRAEQVLNALPAEGTLVIDDGPSQTNLPPTEVRIDQNQWRVLREGVVSKEELERQTVCLVVFVCTGNTCRSPMAEALCKTLLAERLQCPVDELMQRGFLVLSAGMAAMMGDRAAPEAVAAVRALGGDLSEHISRPLAPDVVTQADYLIAMTRGHLSLLAARFPPPGCRPRLLCRDGSDVADPIGAEQTVYRECAQHIYRQLEELVLEIQQP
jgi:protein-tyrosine phosphatase